MMGERCKLPIQAILNRSPLSRPTTPHSQPSASELSSPASDVSGDALTLAMGRPTTSKTKKTRDSSDLSYTKPQHPIKYPPYENLDETALREIATFSIYPFGQISQYCAHIPYSSDKKDVKEKTGRESFHVFVYNFTDPTDKQTYDVMWDYLGGYVRISPFFKSRKHKKTGPAKMLDANPGLRDITFHMTGGNRVAQGYWVPYECARAVCTTFCYPIAGALIPIFGPEFPHDCIRPESPRFGHMDIDPEVIQRSKRNATASRFVHTGHGKIHDARFFGAPTSHPRTFGPLPSHGPIVSDPLRGLMEERLSSYPTLDSLSVATQYWQPPTPMSYNRYQGASNWMPPRDRDQYSVSAEATSSWRPQDVQPPPDDLLANMHPMLRPMAKQNLQAEETYPKRYTAPACYVHRPGRNSTDDGLKRRKLQCDEPEPEPVQSHFSKRSVEGVTVPVLRKTKQTGSPKPDPTRASEVMKAPSSNHRPMIQKQPGYTDEERTAAFSLVNMREKPETDSIEVSGRLKRRRAKSV